MKENVSGCFFLNTVEVVYALSIYTKVNDLGMDDLELL